MSIKFPLWVGISSLMRISTHQHHPNPPLQFDINSLRPFVPARTNPMGRPAQSQPSINCAPSSRAPRRTLIPPRLHPTSADAHIRYRGRNCHAAAVRRAPSLPLSIDRSIHPSRSEVNWADATIRSLIGIIFLFSMLFLGFFLFLSSYGGMKAKL